MSYEIPKNIQYEEKILFNLNIEQTIWIALFGLLTFGLFFKTSLPLEVRIALSLLFTLLAIGFAFFNLKTHALYTIQFLTQPRKLGYLDPQMANFIQVQRIENDTLYLKDGSAKAILQVQPINFNILSTKQKQAIVSAYKDFLNSLDFPIQITMRTVNLDIEEYLKKLEEKVQHQHKPHLEKQFKDFQEFMHQYIEENSVKNRLFYLIIPSEKNMNPIGTQSSTEEQLEVRIKLCQDRLKNCNLITKKLKNNQLISLLSSYHEGFIEKRGIFEH